LGVLVKYTIEGFNQEKMVELEMDCVDAVILRWFIDFKATEKMKDLGNGFMWIYYEALIKDIPIIGIKNKKALYQRLTKMKILEHKTFINKGTFSGYKIKGEILESILYSQLKLPPLEVKTTTPLEVKSDNKDPSTRIYQSTKDKYEDFVFLTINEYGLTVIQSFIQDLDYYLTNNPKKKYSDHNKTIRNWIKRDGKIKKIEQPFKAPAPAAQPRADPDIVREMIAQTQKRMLEANSANV